MGLPAGLTLEAIVIDCRDAIALGRWWSEVLEWPHTIDDDGFVSVFQPDRHAPLLFFMNVPDPKTAKNRLHLDFRDDDQSALVDRFLAHGATRIDIGQGDSPWVVLADPEDNEFCVLASRADQAK
ncbi:VOC family protein [Mycobacteroides abscessus subsp. bolletii]|uniref:VOC family protein n=1 Tax=Mycobacteroides abscessus TaxID=36809 RepID=UPI0005E2509E|nr:VOC family protein [Mycobacteroides abscessus]MDO3126138.1 VOC family protein [Mycobacteroides abscessus subsp. bolletii]CPS07262.1 lactoylglutathione lyase family protein [Mycobacteroides abscessus]CPS23826.1 lactoylglutathione lyase family protein [Mycobacteroides abscessus]CPS26284.1 lactoylglutathione lyase family protein [Mycobacteroides abscessus]CPT06301.1 lactoylglutathione lyase family protein [Mycobacteroides abscessus]